MHLSPDYNTHFYYSTFQFYGFFGLRKKSTEKGRDRMSMVLGWFSAHNYEVALVVE